LEASIPSVRGSTLTRSRGTQRQRCL
jgi:hypothetical protein